MYMLILVVCLTALDQYSKFLVSKHLAFGESLPLIPGLFSFTHTRNTGAAWGMFHDFNGPLVILSIAITICLIVFRKTMTGHSAAGRVAFSFMIAGILGNLADRLRLGFVVDFFDVFRGATHFPTFNVADSCICIGVGLYVLYAFLSGRKFTDDGTPAADKDTAAAGGSQT